MRFIFVVAGIGLAGALTLGAWPEARDNAPAAVAGPAAAQDTTDFLLDQRSKGSAAAPVQVFELSDFQCPWCRKHALETFPELERDYIRTGKVRWTFVNFPITEIHPNAAAAAEFAMCAARINRFWPVHDLVFQHQATWAPMRDPAPALLALADSAGIARDSILPCLINHELRELVMSDARGAIQAGARSTPTFIIQGGLLRGAAPVETFRAILDSILKETGR